MGGEGIGISNWMGCLKRGVARVSNRMEWSDEVFANISNRMGCLKRGIANIFKRMECFGATFAEWFHP